MIEFWLCAGLLLLTALAFLLIPVLRARKVQAEEDRTALNVAVTRLLASCSRILRVRWRSRPSASWAARSR